MISTTDLHSETGQVDQCDSYESFGRDGYVLFPRVLDPNEVARTRDEIDRLSPVHWDFQGSVDHYKCVFNRSAFWLHFIDRHPILEFVERQLGSDCHIIGQTAWRSHPGAKGVGLHTDHVMVEMPEQLLETSSFVPPAFIITAHYYLSDIDEQLCPTWLIPGSHRSGRRPRPGERDWRGIAAEPMLCNAGDVLLFRSDVWHRGSTNRTCDRTRYLLQVHYGRRMIAQKFSPYIHWQFDPKVLAACSPRQRRLLGDHKRAAYD